MDSNFSYTPNGNIYFQPPKKYEWPVVPKSGLLLLEALPHVRAQLERFDRRRAGTYNARFWRFWRFNFFMLSITRAIYSRRRVRVLYPAPRII
jgi:hypothetical protein